MKRLNAALLALMTAALCVGCGETPAETTVATTGPDILGERRQLVQDYMRSQLDFYWTCDEPMPYYRSRTGELEFTFEPGRVYRGIPYTPSGGTTTSFLRYGQGADEKGVHHLSGFSVNQETGEVSVLQLGGDCSTTVFNAWSQIASSISSEKRTTKWMTENNGYLRVGDYQSDPNENSNTIRTCQTNGEQVMYAAYGQLQPGDAVVHFNDGSGHVMMITQCTVSSDTESGDIKGFTSFVRIMDQTSGNMNAEIKEYNEAIGEDVYPIGNLEKVYSFAQLYEKGYLPITCRELVDPAPLAEETLELVPSAEQAGDGLLGQLLSRTVQSNRAINMVTLTVTDSAGAEVQACSFVPAGTYARTLPLSLFVTAESHLLKGTLELEKLEPGSYQLCCEVLSVTGKTITQHTDFQVD